MELDPRVCERARRSRDPRFDGRFFVGVRTTGIYCRPVCPARPPREENVRYFPTASAAAAAGLRPCLRCRPEASPGTPAWLGTSSTVSRALRLIGESALDDGKVEDLARRLGIGSRQLRRLFLKHLGATPVAVAQTRRVHFAKRLVDETDLPFAQVAMVAGFGSIRRFNAVIRAACGRSPQQLRRSAHRPPGEDDSYRFRLRFRPPFAWKELLDFLGPRATPSVESVAAGIYRRTFTLGDQAGWLEARLHRDAVELGIRVSEPRPLAIVVERVRRIFDLDADPELIRRHLGRDPLLRSRLAARPGLRVPGAWDGFELATRAILGQQVSVAAATTLAGRLAREWGRPFSGPPGLTRLFPAPETLVEADIASIGLPRSRAGALRELARAVQRGDLGFAGVGNVERFLEVLRRIPGVGEWTAQYVAMRALGEPDAFPAGDLGLLRATGLERARRLEQRAEPWRPWRAYAAMHLWQGGRR